MTPDAFALVGNLLGLDAKAARHRLHDWINLEAEIAKTESALVSARAANAARAAALAAGRAEAADVLAKFRQRVVIEEGAVAQLEQMILHDEADWRGLRTPHEMLLETLVQ
jgi:hypothetical protein